MEKFLSEEDGFSEVGTNMNLADEMMKAFGHDFEGSDEDDSPKRPGELEDLSEVGQSAGKGGAEADAKASAENSKSTQPPGSAMSIAEISQLALAPSASSDTFSAAVEVALITSSYCLPSSIYPLP